MAKTITTAEYVCTIPDGWLWCICPDKTIVACHPDHPPREFVDGEWREVKFTCAQ